ncbi:MAG TPA: nuclear transport factor 2 family protein [Candidatus Acidoferrum sp.]|nr:nuclear transport factor 2 family protein [Candidatus Acidoferrum sp.]
MLLSKNRQLLACVAGASVAVLLIAAVAFQVYAQSAAQDEALKLQKDFQDKVVAGDADGAGAMMADDAFFIHGNGALQSKAEFLAGIKNGQLSLSAFDVKEAKVTLFDGGAVVSGLEDLTFKPPAGSTAPVRTIHMRGSGLWIHKGGKWLLLFDQDTSLAAPPGPPPAAPAARQ